MFNSVYNVLSINIMEEQHLQSKFNNTCSLENISEDSPIYNSNVQITINNFSQTATPNMLR